MAVKVGEVYRTNLSKPGGLVKVLEIKPYSPSSIELAALVEHIEDHPYGYKKGDRGWYMVTDLVEQSQ